LVYRESGEFKFLSQHTVEFKFEIQTGVERMGVEQTRHTKFAISTESPGGYITQPGISFLEPFSSPHILLRCLRHPAPLSSSLRFAADLPWLADGGSGGGGAGGDGGCGSGATDVQRRSQHLCS
jgi:hypothetical protein